MTRHRHMTEARFKRARDHISSFPGERLDLATLSRIAALSPSHFHRRFRTLFGMSLHRFTQLTRLKHAAFHLAHGTHPITRIALECGFETPDGFARAFRRCFGITPSRFRRQQDWRVWRKPLAELTIAENRYQRRRFEPRDVTIRFFPATPIALMMHQGPAERVSETVQHFISWRKRNGLSPDRAATYTIFFDDPAETPPESLRIGLAAGVLRALPAQGDAVTLRTLPAGRCAMLRLVGRADTIEDAALFLYRDWLPTSGERLRDFPLFCQRVAFYPQVPETRAVVDLYLPLEGAST
ncbi:MULTISPECIES: GyrI-like domain-containing protein [unclassified Asaia]|uniref:AraC family transcriptional regulator n=1 Tax=unclassified Asaia TaxID=2685023 RepID=UPI001F386697|nr:AraC family transcriptional regulator [Asaia sp. W19]